VYIIFRGVTIIIKTINLNNPRKTLANNNNDNKGTNKSKLKNIKFSTYPAIICFIMGFIFLKPDYVYAKDAVHEGTAVINFLSNLGPPSLLTALEIYKVQPYIKMYMSNLKTSTAFSWLQP